MLQAPLPDTTASQSRGAPILPGRAASPVLTGPPGAASTTGIEASNAHTEAQGIQNPSQRGIFTQSLAELTPQVSAEQRWLPPARHRCNPAKEWGDLQPPWEGQAMPPTLPQGCCPSSCISAAQFSPTKPPVGSNGVVVARGHRSPPVRAAGGCSKKHSRTGTSEHNGNSRTHRQPRGACGIPKTQPRQLLQLHHEHCTQGGEKKLGRGRKSSKGDALAGPKLLRPEKRLFSTSSEAAQVKKKNKLKIKMQMLFL